MSEHYVIGLDAGSVSVKTVVLDGHGAVLRHEYRRHKGAPERTALSMLRETHKQFPSARLACTGSAGRTFARRMGAPYVNELVALSLAVTKLHPDATTVFEMGGQDAKLLLLGGGGLRDFALNSVCAAGTGSFLDQQAERLGLTIEQFAQKAMESERPPRIAGRCSVFAKSDMIHLQQIATPMRDIVAGLCFAVVRNVQSTLVRNRQLSGKMLFLGGVALNKGVVRGFQELLSGAGTEVDVVHVPDPPTAASAAGAAFKAHEQGNGLELTQAMLQKAATETHGSHELTTKPPLRQPGDTFEDRHDLAPPPDDASIAAALSTGTATNGDAVPAYMGIDIGSISTNLAVVDERGALIAKRYLRTAGQPIEAVRRGLSEIGSDLSCALGGRVEIRGVGTTGSGRYMIADFVSADVVKNEITAQATAAAFIDPQVDTVLEIGGQDSKYIRIHGGVIADFEMNKACAAGTGSFLEEQAEKLGIDIKDEFARRALGADAPASLGERCTVFMENSLMDGLQRGADTDNLLAGLSYSIVENYINRVVAGRAIGKRVFFQGGTAFNKAVVAAFEQYLGRAITVPPHHDVTGAIGMGLIARDHVKATGRPTSFKGFDLADRKYELSSFECKGCDNRCEINKVAIEGEKDKLFYGGRCEKWDQRLRPDESIEDLFAFRTNALTNAHETYLAQKRRSPRGPIGVPRVFFFHDYLPLFATILWELGFDVRLTPETTRDIASLGVRTTLEETCYPVKGALGHVRALSDQGVHTIFLPSFVNMARPDSAYDLGHACPLTQSFPYQVRAAMPHLTVLAPVLRLSRGRKQLLAQLRTALSSYTIGDLELTRAIRKGEKAQRAYETAIRNKGRDVHDMLLSGADNRRSLLIAGRPYNAFDSGMNLEIPKKLALLGVRAIPMDILAAAHGKDIHEDWPEMYWRSGQRILEAARTAKEYPDLHPLVIGNFSCGPDSFILQYFQDEMGEEQFLHIEIDEHSADAGVITRCEAFLDSLAARKIGTAQNTAQKTAAVKKHTRTAYSSNGDARTVYIPHMCDHSFAMRAAFEACGVNAEVLPTTGNEAMALARRHVTGKECYPFAVTTGDLLHKVFSPDFDPDRSAFLMPGGTGPCRFGQYNVLQRMLLDRAGFGNVPIYSPAQDVQFYSELGLIGSDYPRISWEGISAIDMLVKCLHETRPVEAVPGTSDALYDQFLRKLDNELPKGRGRAAAVLAQARDAFESVERDLGQANGSRPLIGVVGEIFVRSNLFSNEDLVRRVENLGGRAWLAPIDEWVYYVNWHSMDNARRRGQWKKLAALALRDHVQHSMARKHEREFDGFLETLHEADTRTILRSAAPHLHSSFRGEAILSVGKALDMVRRGASGIVCAMPFGCMPGTIAASILRPACEKLSIPFIAIPFDGTRSPTARLQLETFMEQARQTMERRASTNN